MNTPIKLGVFVGSTKEDLADARDVVIRAILNAGHFPSGMELWAAGHVPTIDAIERHLNLCDIHIVMLGARYGHMAQDNMSFTEWEYSLSKKHRRPVIAFLLDREAFEWETRDHTSSPALRRLRRFRKDLEDHALCRYFKLDNVQEIGLDCINSINEAINSGSLKEGVGWIRSGSEQGQRLREIERNPFLQRILDTIYGFSTLTTRLDREPIAKRAIGEVLWNQMFGKIYRYGYHNLFFESGSTF